jgi:hypothetical protein
MSNCRDFDRCLFRTAWQMDGVLKHQSEMLFEEYNNDRFYSLEMKAAVEVSSNLKLLHQPE